MLQPNSLKDVLITSELKARPRPVGDGPKIEDLLSRLIAMSDMPSDELLQAMVNMAVEASGYKNMVSAGVSLSLPGENQQIHWAAVSGMLAAHKGLVTSRAETPCNLCVDSREPMLMGHPQQYFLKFGPADTTITELLMVPFGLDTDHPGALWLAAHGEHQFHQGTVELLGSLADNGAKLYASMHKRDEFAARLSRKADQQTLLDQLPIGMAKLDREYRYTYLNDRAIASLKTSAELLLGRSVWEVYPQVAGTFVQDAYQSTMEDRVVNSIELFFEPVQSWFDVESHPAADGGIVVFFYDVEDRKQRESELMATQEAAERQRRFYTTILTTTPDFAYIWGADYTFLYGNQSLLDLYGLKQEEYVGKSFRDVGYPEWHARMHEQEIDEVVRTGQPLRGKIPFRSKGGGGVYDYIFMPVFGPDGKVEAIAGTTRDVTALERSAEALKEADRRKDEFLAVLAHELRNPLAPLRSGVELLAEDSDPDVVKQAHRIMSRQVEHMVQLVDDLMDLSRVNRGLIDLAMEPIELRDVLEAAVEVVRPMIEQHQHRLHVEFHADPIMINGNSTRLTQIFGNLLNNAAKYTQPGGSITLQVEKREDQVSISVTDTGVGIRPEDQTKVFEMFAQVSRQTDRAQGGLGIGLNIVQRLTRMHGGSISVSSEGLGNGSVFTVHLPLAKVQVKTSPQKSEGIGMEGVKPLRIMIVDDNVDAAFVLSMLLKKMDHEVHAMHGGEEAIELVKDFRPDVVFLDIGMPGMDGYEVCRRIRGLEGVEKIHIVALTGWGQKEDKERAKEAGFDQHLVKPTDRETIVRLLAGFSEGRS
ncbi:MAG: ATP-binding protein [Flavobacteriales bacterium]